MPDLRCDRIKRVRAVVASARSTGRGSMKRALIAGLISMAAALAQPPAEAQTSVPRNRTLVIAQNFDPQSLWPNATTASDNLNAGAAVVEPLYWPDPRTGKPQPLLVESHRLLEPTLLQLKLRAGVKFSNGEPMNADAVVHSIKLFIDPKAAPAYAIYAKTIASAEKLDDLTVNLRMAFPYPAVDLLLTQIYVTPPAYWNQVGAAAFQQKPIGTGPFKFVEWVKDNRLVMDRNETYWGKGPQNVDRVIWRPVPDDTARAAGLETGEYDIATNLAITSVLRLETQSQLQIDAVPSFRIFQLILSSLDIHPSPLRDKRVRQAINHAIDKDAIIKNLLFGKARALSGQVLRREQLGHEPALKDYPFDLAKAKALLTEAGHPNGFSVVFKFPSGRYAQDREVSEAIAGMLAKAGIRTEMVVLEPGEFLRQLRGRELAPIAFLGLAPLDDPD
ncbi:MAG: hypothetical protein FJX57_03140, partial [Alphaproteobacteria bacterium]|nr:hypothetical protein [Alphaproteobacteria bacterium]